MKHMSFDGRPTMAEMNKLVRSSSIQCHATGCTKPATRYSHLCDWCEICWQQRHEPVFGFPSPKEIATAKKVITAHFRANMDSGLFNGW